MWRGLWLTFWACAGLSLALTSSRAAPWMNAQSEAQSAVRERAARALSEADKRRESGVADDLRDAVSKYEAACTLWREIGERRQLAVTLARMGGALRDLHDDERAVKSLSEALELAGELGDDATKAESLMLLGMLLMRRGDLQAASERVESAYSISRQLGNRRLQSAASACLAEIQANVGDMPKANEYARRSLDVAKEDGDRKGMARALMWLGYVSKDTQGNEEALELLAQSLALAREANDLPGVVDAMTQIGHQYSSTGEKQRALETYLNAEFYADRLKDPERQGRLLAGLDFVNEELGNLELSLEYCQESIRLYHKANYPLGEFQRYERLGKLQFQAGDYPHALDNYSTALAFFRKSGMKNFVYYVLSEIGEVYEQTGENARALEYYTQARQLIRVEDDPREYAYVLNRLGRITERTKGVGAALDFYSEALKLNRQVGDLFGESATLLQIAQAEKSRNRPVEARASAEAALRIDEKIRDQVAVSDLRASYFAVVNQHFDFYIELLMEQGGAASESNVSKALEISERKRARTLLDEVAAKRSRGEAAGGAGNLLERERKLKAERDAKRDEYAKLRRDRQSSSNANLVANELLRLSQEYDQVRAVVASQLDQGTQSSAPLSLTAREIQGVTDDADTLLLEYSLGDERSYLWAVTRDSIEGYKLPRRAEIESDVLELGQAIKAMMPQQSSGRRQAAEAEEQFRIRVQKLSAVLLAPVSARLARAKRLVIIADGALQYVPFSALPTPELNPTPTAATPNGESRAAPTTLLATHEVSLLPSVAVLVASRQRSKNLPAPSKTIAVIADPVFERDDDRIRAYQGTAKGVTASSRVREPSPASSPAQTGASAPAESRQQSNDALLSQVLRDTDAGGLPRLFATQFEAQGILSLADRGQSFAALSFDASRRVLTSERLKDYRIIHIATHGFLDSEHPELSGIVLSLYDEKGQPQNGFVQLSDIYDMEINADMVVLSACQTGLGKEVKGEGLTGLPRAFMSAGARRVVASLWKVDDDATAELMTNFYRHLLKEKMTPSAALRAAQLEVSAQRRWRQPFYWAGFFLSGDFR
jgi:CHAT domain-containing protein/tetratricopeptide (TPR) repeat protein